jgi:thiamine biosynthesis protein ThiS
MESPKPDAILITINGAEKPVPSGLTVSTLLDFLAIKPGRVAVELNRAIVRKQDWCATPVEGGAQVEVVWFVGGGAR